MRRTTAFLILLGLCASLLVSASCVKRRSDLSDMCVKVYPETGEPSSPFDQTLTRINISTQYAVGAVYNLEFVDETGAEVHDSNYMQGEIRFQQSEHLYQNVLFDVKTGKWSPRLSSRLRRGAQPVEGMHGQVLGTLAPSGAIRWHASSLVFLKDLALLSNTAFREMRFMQPLSLELRDIWDENWQGIVTYLPLGVEHFDGQRAVRVSVSSLGVNTNKCEFIRCHGTMHISLLDNRIIRAGIDITQRYRTVLQVSQEEYRYYVTVKRLTWMETQ